MITDKDAASLCVASYASFDNPNAANWDLWEDGSDNDGVAYGVKTVDSKIVVVFPGSRVFLDWRRDLDAWPTNPTVHEQLGRLHPGFYHGMEITWGKLREKFGPRSLIYTGHSLGAARANLMCALDVLDTTPVFGKVLFGEPKSGMAELAAITAKVPGRTYRNGGDRFHDQVTDTPYYLPLAPYQHDRDFSLINAEPDAFDEWGFFAWHHMPLYASKTPPFLITT